MIGNYFWGGGGAAPYAIEQSLRFDGSSYLQRTSTTTSNRQQMTISVWAKFINDPFNTGDNHNTWYGTGNISSASGHVRLSVGNGSGQHPYFLLIQNNGVYISTPQFRDPGAWYHLVTSYNAATSTHRCWVNGVEITNWSTNQQSSSSLAYPNSGDVARIGVTVDSGGSLSNYMKGYLAEYHYLESAVTDPNDFGEYDDNGVWRPIEVTGLTYGTNGFYLKFDPTATNGIGHDHSGNGNNFTPSGFTTSGTGTDVMSDTPTKNFPTWNPLERADGPTTEIGDHTSEGNLVAAMQRDGGDGAWVATFTVPSSGKWYWEVEQLTAGTPNPFISTGIIAYPWTWNSSDHVRYDSRGRIGKDWNDVTYQSTTAWGAGYGNASDVCGVAVDADNNTVQFYLNGTSKGTTESYSGNTYTYVPHCTTAANTDQNVRYNFGQRAFAYTPPTGFKALNTSNLPAPDIADGSDYFNTVLYTGNGSTQSITVADSQGNSWAPDFVWLKMRSAVGAHFLYDTVRGATAGIHSNLTDAETTYSDGLTSFNNDGFSLGNRSNNNGSSQTYVAWNWLAGNGTSTPTQGTISSTASVNQTAGFSIVSYTGTGTAGTVGHGLGVPPNMIITKIRSATSACRVYHSTQGASKYANLNSTNAFATNTAYYGGVEPTSSVYSIGTAGGVNSNNETYIAYCFAEVEGYSKFGSYTGNGSSDGPFIFTGHKPAWILVKRSTGVGDWTIYDVKRDTYNIASKDLVPNSSTAEPSVGSIGDILSNGFKIRNQQNVSGQTYIFASFASHPFGGSGVSPATAR